MPASRRVTVYFAFSIASGLISTAAQAYIGPGPGVALFGSLLTTLLVTAMSVLAVIVLPFRLLWRRWQARRTQAADEAMKCKS